MNKIILDNNFKNISITLDRNKYKNLVNAYSKSLFDYFDKTNSFYVVTKVRKHSFLDIFKKTDAISIINFTPCFLVRKNSINALVTFNKWVIDIKRINDIQENIFYLDNYKYKVQNEIINK